MLQILESYISPLWIFCVNQVIKLQPIQLRGRRGRVQLKAGNLFMVLNKSYKTVKLIQSNNFIVIVILCFWSTEIGSEAMSRSLLVYYVKVHSPTSGVALPATSWSLRFTDAWPEAPVWEGWKSRGSWTRDPKRSLVTDIGIVTELLPGRHRQIQIQKGYVSISLGPRCCT